MSEIFIVLRQELVAGAITQPDVDAARAAAADLTLRDGEPRVVVRALLVNERVTDVITRPFGEEARRG